MFWPTRLMYSVTTGSSINFASLSTSAASWRPSATSFSRPPAIQEMKPPLILRLPIMAGASSVASGVPWLAVGVLGVVAVVVVCLSCLFLESCCCAVVLLSCCGSVAGCATAAMALVQRLKASNVAVMKREKRLFMVKSLQKTLREYRGGYRSRSLGISGGFLFLPLRSFKG